MRDLNGKKREPLLLLPNPPRNKGGRLISAKHQASDGYFGGDRDLEVSMSSYQYDRENEISFLPPTQSSQSLPYSDWLKAKNLDNRLTSSGKDKEIDQVNIDPSEFAQLKKIQKKKKSCFPFLCGKKPSNKVQTVIGDY